MSSKRLFGNIMLLIAALLWGSTFAAQSVASNTVEPFTFLASRSLLGFLFLVPVCLIKDAVSKKNGTFVKPNKKQQHSLIVGGVCCGAALTIASGLQQFGMTGDNSGKAGFITAMYILLVPIVGLFFKKKVAPITWLCVGMGVLGLYLLCIKEGFIIEQTDIFLMICAVAFTFHILVIDHFSPNVDGIKMSCIQFFVVTIVATTLALIFESTSVETVLKAWFPIVYAGILSSGIAYTLQIIAQKHTDPTVASLLMSIESVFAVLTGMVVLSQFPTARELWGSLVMFLAIIISQLPSKNK